MSEPVITPALLPEVGSFVLFGYPGFDDFNVGGFVRQSTKGKPGQLCVKEEVFLELDDHNDTEFFLDEVEYTVLLKPFPADRLLPNLVTALARLYAEVAELRQLRAEIHESTAPPEKA